MNEDFYGMDKPVPLEARLNLRTTDLQRQERATRAYGEFNSLFSGTLTLVEQKQNFPQLDARIKKLREMAVYILENSETIAPDIRADMNKLDTALKARDGHGA